MSGPSSSNESSGYWRQCGKAWDAFWFTPQRAETLCAIRIATGILLVYCHIVWATRLMDFFGPNAWIDAETIQTLHARDHAWSYLWSIENPTILWIHHGVVLMIATSFLLGFATRITAPLAWFTQLMYMHRLTGCLFGLDQVVTMLLMYLMLAPCGARWSIDAILRRRMTNDTEVESRWRFWLPDQSPRVSVRVATRLLQLHLCVLYLFGGISKMRGEMWWDGTALWFAAASYEYQSLDITWIGHYPLLFSALTNLTVFWEAFYPALIWPRLTRPWILGMAVLVHGGIAIALGMITFGTAMIVANAIFIPPETLARWTKTSEQPRG